MSEGTKEPKGQPLVTGLLRGLEVLRCFDLGHERLGSSDIARMTGLPQPTVWRLCKTLEHGGYLIADRDGSRFRPGLSILTLGYAALDTLELADLARPLLQDVATRFHGGASLSTRERTSMLYLQRYEAPNAVLNVNVRVGSEVPIMNSGTGWAYLAGLDDAARAQALHECKAADAALYRKHEKGALKAIADYRKIGFITNIDVFFPGLSTVAVPLPSAPGGTPYVLNCTSPSAALADPEVRHEAGLALMHAVEQLRRAAARLDTAG